MKTIWAVVLVFAAADARAGVKDKIPPKDDVEEPRFSREEVKAYRRVGNGDFSLLTIEEMKEYLKSAKTCFDEVDAKKKEDQKKADDEAIAAQLRAMQQGEPQRSLSYFEIAADKYNNIFGSGGNSGGEDWLKRQNRGNAAYTQTHDASRAASAKKREAREVDCLVHAKQYRQTMHFYHLVMNTNVESLEPIPDPDDKALAEGFSFELLRKDKSSGRDKAKELEDRYRARIAWNLREGAIAKRRQKSP